MRKASSIITILTVALAVFFPQPHKAAAAENPGTHCKDTDLKKLEFPLPAVPEEISYLGLGDMNKQTFNLSQIKARIVIVEVFNIYCRGCQEEAPKVNALFDVIKRNKMDTEIKIVGIGLSSSDFGLKVFKFRFNIQFPLFSDLDGVLCRVLGSEATPTFYVIRMKGADEARVVFNTEEGLTTPEDFLNTVLLSANTEIYNSTRKGLKRSTP